MKWLPLKDRYLGPSMSLHVAWNPRKSPLVRAESVRLARPWPLKSPRQCLQGSGFQALPAQALLLSESGGQSLVTFCSPRMGFSAMPQAACAAALEGRVQRETWVLKHGHLKPITLLAMRPAPGQASRLLCGDKSRQALSAW